MNHYSPPLHREDVFVLGVLSTIGALLFGSGFVLGLSLPRLFARTFATKGGPRG